ncbi:MAG: urate hydroxylase PuuD [Bdellovibrionia bacterium]
MQSEIYEWMLLLGRWIHITTAITWIGTSIFFMWLDRTFEFNEKSKSPGHVGDLWMVHGGGFYHVEKLQMGPTKVPEHLHWFKWESYWTWFSGIFLLLMIFYVGSGTFLIDSSVSKISYWQAVSIGLGSIFLSWFFYDLLWESRLTKSNPLAGHALTIIWFGAVSYFLMSTLSGRAAYLHSGALLATWMTANVFLRIIPRQVKMVEAAKTGGAVNQDWPKNAKNRSTHNTYFTLPVIFTMLSNHFPSTYGNKHSWIILILITAAGAAIREYFVARVKSPGRSKAFGAIGAAIIVLTVAFTRENTSSNQVVADPAAETVAQPPPRNSEAPGGVVAGVVSFVGTPPKGDHIILPPGCSNEMKSLLSDEISVTGGKLKNVLARIIKGWESLPAVPVPAEPVYIDQKNCMYAPRVVGVRVGQKVEFINSDPTFHNVRTVTKNNEDFNVAMPSLNDRMTKVFTKPEIVLQTKCSVHPWMTASIAVMEHPYFAVSDANGVFSIPGLPPGKYTLELWHETLGTQTREIELVPGSSATLEISFKK